MQRRHEWEADVTMMMHAVKNFGVDYVYSHCFDFEEGTEVVCVFSCGADQMTVLQDAAMSRSMSSVGGFIQ